MGGGRASKLPSHSTNMLHMFVPLLCSACCFLSASYFVLCSVAILWLGNALRKHWMSHPPHSRGLQPKQLSNNWVHEALRVNSRSEERNFAGSGFGGELHLVKKAKAKQRQSLADNIPEFVHAANASAT